jgi:hypothetical protein
MIPRSYNDTVIEPLFLVSVVSPVPVLLADEPWHADKTSMIAASATTMAALPVKRPFFI